jgi:hypothetical protein
MSGSPGVLAARQLLNFYLMKRSPYPRSSR